ncbi:MAG: RnfABCDGE type electron transport complex subunit D [Bacteroidales bacterium]|nr:RnfABCDGE type electron transport complex subunit D [Bacteroidales bacterium]
MLTVSPSPHYQSETNTTKLMCNVLIALVPAFIFSLIVFGISSLILTITAIVSCCFFEFAINKWLFKNEDCSIKDCSAIITGLLLSFNLPNSLPLWMVVIGSLVAIGIAKMSFGGLGCNIFNPALVGRVFLLISFPAQMTTWTKVQDYTIDGTTGATPLGMLKENILSGKTISQIDLPTFQDLFIGNIGGSLGEISVIALIIGGLYLLFTKTISWHIPVSVLGSMFLFSGILFLINPEIYANPLFHIFSGGAMLGAIFMATDYATSPMTPTGKIIFGIGIGFITIIIRSFGAYPEGMSFAILLMNALTPLINKIQPRFYGSNK